MTLSGAAFRRLRRSFLPVDFRLKGTLFRLLARLVFQLPDFDQLPGYQTTIVRLRRTVLGRSSGVVLGHGVVLHPRFYYPRDVRVVLGDRCAIKRDVRLGRETGTGGPAVFKVGLGTEVLSGCRFDCSDSISIGDGSHIGRDCQIVTHTHLTGDRSVPVLKAPVKTQSVSIGNDVMIYSDVVILPGVAIGDGAVVAVRSVVTNDVEPYTVVAGVPARKIGERT